MTCHVARRTSEFERRLRRERRQAYRALETMDAELTDRAEDHPGEFLDDAARETTCGVLESLEDREHRVLAEIEAAEGRLAMGTFGVCAACGRPIAVERLRALPTARLCVGCGESVERRALSETRRLGERIIPRPRRRARAGVSIRSRTEER
jgi:DnaK suppressor protein